MERISTTQENVAEKLQAFRADMEEIKKQEDAGSGTAHFLNMEFNPEDLLPEDMAIYEKVLKGTITWEDWKEYEDSIIDPETNTVRTGVSATRYIFKAFIGNKATIPLMSKERAQR
ncbi:MAG: hypothetical protein AAB897_02805 [Patescibacteria group bacterium]